MDDGLLCKGHLMPIPVTNLTQLSPSWESNSYSATQVESEDSFPFSQKPTTGPTLSQKNPMHVPVAFLQENF
jgi:hypothetical protein